MKSKWFNLVLAGALITAIVVTTPVGAEEQKAADDPAKESLAKESEEACKASAKDKPTPEIIVKKVEEACKLLEKEGKAAFPKFSGKDSQFIFCGTYMGMHDMEGVITMNPIKYKMVGKRLIGLKDANGKLFIAEANKLVREKGACWIAYMWPKPGEEKPSQKVSYFKAVKVDGVDMVVQCGVYDMPEDVIKKLVDSSK